jgi:aspartate aminotransferase
MNYPVKSPFTARVLALRESATLKINAQVNRMKQEGKLVYNLTAGEPDFPAPEVAKQAVMEAVQKNQSKYTPTAGILELRQLIAVRTNAQQPNLKTPWTAADVMVTNGGKQALFDAILALIDQNDEVLIPAPYWLSYPEMVRAAQGTPVEIATTLSERYLCSPEKLEAAITSKTKLFILNSPSNPTGAMYSENHLRKMGDVLRKHESIWIISDEIYDQIEFKTGSWRSFLAVNPELQSRTVTVNGLSKSGAMTGWRIGWSVTDSAMTSVLNALQGHSTSGISALSQAAAVATLKLAPGWFESQRRQYLHRRDLTLEILRKSAKIKVFEPDGAFYLFMDVQAVMKENENADGFAVRLLQEKGVAVVSGVDFGAPTSVRISFATDEATLREAAKRLVEFCDQP